MVMGIWVSVVDHLFIKSFIFCQLAQDADIEVHLHDVETLNLMAFKAVFDVTKLSFHAWLRVQDQYELLGCGAALGRGCGPLSLPLKPQACSLQPRLPFPANTPRRIFCYASGGRISRTASSCRSIRSWMRSNRAGPMPG